jgi:hypothetical protein
MYFISVARSDPNFDGMTPFHSHKAEHLASGHLFTA